MRKQQQIIAAARDVLVLHGIAGCTERQVAAAAGVAKNAVHYYFADTHMLELLSEALRRDAQAGRDVSVAAAADVYVLLLGSVVDQTTRATNDATVKQRVHALVTSSNVAGNRAP